MPDSMPSCYRSLTEKCWSQEPNERPAFNEIVNQLKTDSNFITEKIQKDDHLEYIDFIEKSQISFNWSHKILQVDEFIQSKNRIRETEIIDENTK
ncbi:hypothetical protein M9Y10_028307 [Tritrichomonas musculus]|uniref:Serine-threonine/tyrosine-protein kinase catalytic domain-containing protein n=1 Tax=Tritrichomonas musculus TaxID=1915356 RepID=A0ABR2KJP2_9EUKA